MPSRERYGGEQPPQEEPPSQQEAEPYFRASRFTRERLAKRAYFRAQETIRNATDCELSVYRFLLNRISHVAVVGERPAEELDRRLGKIQPP